MHGLALTPFLIGSRRGGHHPAHGNNPSPVSVSTTQAWRCDYCTAYFATREACVVHEASCPSNPSQAATVPPETNGAPEHQRAAQRRPKNFKGAKDGYSMVDDTGKFEAYQRRFECPAQVTRPESVAMSLLS